MFALCDVNKGEHKVRPYRRCRQRAGKIILGSMFDIFDLHGKAALVTGSSRGIGAATVLALARCGARCVVNYVADAAGKNRWDAEGVAAQIEDATIIECDVGDVGQVQAMMQQIHRGFGGLNILVNNAGVMRDRSIRKLTAEDWDFVLRVNLQGTFNCIQQAMPFLRSGGRIVNIASVSGNLGFYGQANYASSKAAVMALTKVAARELAMQQVTVNAIAPGFIETEMTREMPPEAKSRFLQQIPLGRWGTADDIANAVLLLCSPAAAYITGHTLHVNGGFFMA